EALSTIWRMHVGGVAGQQNPSVAVGRSLPGDIGEPGDPRGTVDSVICPAYSDQRFAEIAQCGFGRGPDVLFGHHDPYGSAILVNHLTPSNLVLQPAEGMDAKGVAMDAELRFLGHLDLAIRLLVVGSHPGNAMP